MFICSRDTRLITSGVAMPELLENYLRENVDDASFTLEAVQEDLQAFVPCKFVDTEPQLRGLATMPTGRKRTNTKPVQLVIPKPD